MNDMLRDIRNLTTTAVSWDKQKQFDRGKVDQKFDQFFAMRKEMHGGPSKA